MTGFAKKELSQRKTSGVFGTQTHRSTAVHYKEGVGWGAKERTDQIRDESIKH